MRWKEWECRTARSDVEDIRPSLRFVLKSSAVLAAATALDCDEARELQSYRVYKQSLTLGKGMGVATVSTKRGCCWQFYCVASELAGGPWRICCMGTGIHPPADPLLLLLVTHVSSFCTPTCLPVCHLDLASTWSQQVVRAHQIKSFVAQRCSSCAATCLATGSPGQTAAGRTCRPRCLVLPLPMRGTRCPGRRQRPARWAAWSSW